MVKIFADGAEVVEMWKHNQNPLIKGLTTNPTLMKKVGIIDYEAWALQVLSVVNEKPVSFEVFADDFKEMERQAKLISLWGDNVYVKIPITNTRGELSIPLIDKLSSQDIKVNVTAIMTIKQVVSVMPYINRGYISIFAGRIADTGVDPIPIMTRALDVMKYNNSVELIWASPREVLNVVQASAIGCHIITCTSDIIKKLPLIGKDLDEYSLETVKMFYEDGKGFRIG